jgi:hypothetical protein
MPTMGTTILRLISSTVKGPLLRTLRALIGGAPQGATDARRPMLLLEVDWAQCTVDLVDHIGCFRCEAAG